MTKVHHKQQQKIHNLNEQEKKKQHTVTQTSAELKIIQTYISQRRKYNY
jgi:hypothetical protein